MDNLTIKEIHLGLLEKKFSALELARFYLDKIKKDPTDSFITVTEEEALLSAKRTDDLIAKKQDAPLLSGVPMAIKDVIMYEKTTCASKILQSYQAPYQATCIEKLLDQGVIILGKTNLDEFAMGASTENSAFKITKNPHDLKRVPGGSSGGSAAAVSADLCCCALGSDTGGSVRQPASFCGVVGFKPTYGAVSRYGLVAYASSLDQIGPIAKTSEDAEIIFDAIRGKDPKDSTSLQAGLTEEKKQPSELRIGIVKEYLSKGTDPEVTSIIRKAIKKMEDLGARIVDVELPNTKYAIPAYYLIATSECSSNLARFDGLKYGFSDQKDTLEKIYSFSRAEGFGREVKRRIMLGTYSLSAGYYEDFYLKAQKVRSLIRGDFQKAFKKADLIFAPVAPTPAFRISEKINDPIEMYLSDIFTVSANLAGIPAISVPAGDLNGLPVGLQIMGRYMEDKKVLQTAKIFK